MHSFSWLTRFLQANGNFKCMIFKSWPSVNSIRHSLNTLMKDGKIFHILELMWSCFCVCICICSQWERENSYLVQFWTSKREVGGNLGSKTSQELRNKWKQLEIEIEIEKYWNSWAGISPVDASCRPPPHLRHLFSIRPTFQADKYSHILHTLA